MIYQIKSHQKNAIHSNDIAKHIPQATNIDNKMADARHSFDWSAQWKYDIVKTIRRDTKPKIEANCSMRKKFCTVKSVNKALEGDYIDIL